MKKSIKKTVNYLKQYIGHEILRTKPSYGDWSYTSDSILLLGFTPDGCIRCLHTGIEAKIFKGKEDVLPIEFTDRNWITHKSAKKSKNNELNKWKGKRIRRVRPAGYDRSFMREEPPTLITASKHHIVIRYEDWILKGRMKILDSRYNKLEDWEVVE